MIPELWAEALESLPLAATLRSSVWAYPLVNAGHILGIALLVGGIVPLDLRILVAWSSVPLAALWRVLVYTAGTGLGIAAVCGGLLFITRASAYASYPLFSAKMVFVGIGLVNALTLHLSTRARPLPIHVPWHFRFQAILSLAIWLTVLLLGRLVGYY